jgi:hypothetical protein
MCERFEIIGAAYQQSHDILVGDSPPCEIRFRVVVKHA